MSVINGSLVTESAGGNSVTGNRIEKLRLTATMDRVNYLAVKEHADLIIKEAGGTPIPLRDGDTVTVSYNFYIDYTGRIVKAFDAFLHMFRQEGVVKTINLEELTGKEIMIKTLLDQIQQLKGHLAK